MIDHRQLGHISKYLYQLLKTSKPKMKREHCVGMHHHMIRVHIRKFWEWKQEKGWEVQEKQGYNDMELYDYWQKMLPVIYPDIDIPEKEKHNYKNPNDNAEGTKQR